jgi:hypothetical protein
VVLHGLRGSLHGGEYSQPLSNRQALLRIAFGSAEKPWRAKVFLRTGYKMRDTSRHTPLSQVRFEQF